MPVAAIPNTTKAISRSLWPLLGTQKSHNLGSGPRGSSFVLVTREYSRIASSTSRKVWTACLWRRRSSFIQSRRSVRFRDHSACLKLFDCFIVTHALFIEARSPQHRKQVVRPRERQSVHQGATNEHCYARHYFRISARMRPCLISMSLVAMARATSTMPTSRASS